METTKKKKQKFQLLDNSSSNIPSGNVTYFIAFFIPLIMFIALYYVKNIFPFGTNCYLRSDMYHQYAPFFSELWNKLRSGESLTYSWNIGMGTNFTSLYAYYLASPTNWLIMLFPQKYMIEIMNALIILKLSAASLTMTYYISKHFKTKSCVIALFGIFYGMSGYVAAYSWNIMWLDCILLVPLIMLGLERLVYENKGLLYCITLGLCIYTNYYISIMVCISVVLYFIVLMLSNDKNNHVKIVIKKVLHWGIYSLLAGGLAACLLLPEIYTFSLSASSSISFPQTLTSYFSVMNMLTRHLINVPVHLGLEHYPNIYCGVAAFLLIPLYVMDKKVKSREKIGKVVILLIFLTSFNLNIPNFIWHGFHFPNSLPCRQSFIYIFFILTMGYEAFHHLKSITNKQIAGALWIAIGFLLIAEQIFTTDGTYDFKIIYTSGAFILIYALLIYLHKNTNWNIPVFLFLAFSCTIIECTMNMDSTGLGTTSRTSYLLDYESVENVTNTIAASDDSLYRMDKIYGARSKNDGAWHNYRTISTFSSTSNAGVSDLFGLLGFEHSTNSYGFDGATLVTESLFSVKYLISNKLLVEDDFTSYVTGANGEFVYRNNYTLPIGYIVRNDLNEVWKPNSSYNGIENQNTLIEAATGVSNVFTLTYEFPSNTDIEFLPVKDGHMYLYLRNNQCDSIGVSINGTVTNHTGLKNGNHIIDLGYVTTTDTINVYSENDMQLSVYTLESDRFIQAYNTLNQESLNVTSFSDTKIKGNVTATDDGTLMFSIPYDEGWTVYVDGKKAELTNIKDAFLAVRVSEGSHDIELKYIPKNLILGCFITFLSILALIGITLFHKFRREGRIVTSKWPLLLQELIDEQDIVYERPAKIIMTQTDINNIKAAHSDSNSSNDKQLSDPDTFNLDSMNDFDMLEDMDSEETNQ